MFLVRNFKRFHSKLAGDIKIYDCKTKTKIPLVLNPSYSSWYTCGPTVYDSAHVGHASTYVRFDIVQRILRDYFNVNLITCMNITNIDDKIINKSHETGKPCQQISEEYETEFWEDLKSLNVVLPDIKLRVTDRIPEIINFIDKIIVGGFGTIAEDGSVYFKTDSYKNYAKLQNIDSQPDSNTSFALWKGARPNEPFWETKWGRGRPGWHIECSTLASLIFGQKLDFHAGGIDLRFPHHENEEAQSCVYHGVNDWVSYWMHSGHLNQKGQEKMSKSLKNTITIRQMLNEYSSDQFRVACLLSNYRSSLEYGSDLMNNAQKILNKFQTFDSDCKIYAEGLRKVNVDSNEVEKALKLCSDEVEEAFKDDFNTPKALNSALKLMSHMRKMFDAPTSSEISRDGREIASIQAVSNYLSNFFKLLGVEKTSNSKEKDSADDIDKLITSLIKVRDEIRQRAKETKNKDLFKVSDDIRDALSDNKIEIKDIGKSTIYVRK